MKRRTPLKRAGRIKPKKRSAADFQRVYGSRERVAWVTTQRCVACGAVYGIENAHTVTGGKGRKADYTTIIPLCRADHRAYDEHLFPFDKEEVRDYAKRQAGVLEERWQAYCRRSA